MSFETVKLTSKGSVFYLTLNRPEKRNAMNDTMMSEIVEAINQVEEQDGRVIVFRGEGKGFCAGADLNTHIPIAKPQGTTGFGAYVIASNRIALGAVPR